jgi:hypothetical protein
MKKNSGFVIMSVVVTAILCVCSNDSNPVDPLTAYTSRIETARTRIQDIRDLQFIKPVKVGTLLRSDYAKRFTPRLDSNDALLVYKQIGFLPDSLKSINAYLTATNSAFAAAFYTFGTDSISVVDVDKYSQNSLEVLMAHEFVHALQDQYFHPTSSVTIPYEQMSHFNSDFYLARKCMIEGDARFSEITYMSKYGFLSMSPMKFIQNKCDSFYLTLRRQAIPRYLNVTSNFPYWTGAKYVMQMHNKDGWTPVNEMYHANRVMSTAEIILSKKIEPVIFDMAALSKKLQNSSTKIRFMDDDNYGPVMMMALLSDYCSVDDLKNAFGWRGDRLLYVLSDTKRYGSFVWAMSFDYPDNAYRMLTYIRAFLRAQKINNSSFVETLALDTCSNFEMPDLTAKIICKGTSLYWLENIDNEEDVIATITTSSASLAKSAEPVVPRNPALVETKIKLLDAIFGL